MKKLLGYTVFFFGVLLMALGIEVHFVFFIPGGIMMGVGYSVKEDKR